MRLIDVIKRGSRSLRSAKARTVLTSLAIAVGGLTLTFTLAAGNGIRSYTDRLVESNFDPAELIVGRDAEVSNDGTPNTEPKEYDDSVASLSLGGEGGSLQVKQVTDEDIANLKTLPYVDQVRENYTLNVRYITGDSQKKYTLAAQPYNPSQKPELKAGNLSSENDLKTGTVIVPDAYIAPLGLGNAEEAIGKTIRINVQEPFNPTTVQSFLESGGTGALGDLQPGDKTAVYTVAGVSRKAPTSINFGALPVLLSHADARSLYDYTTKGTSGYGKYLYVSVKIKDGQNEAQLKAAQDDLQAKGYFTQSSKDIQASITQIVNILQILVAVFGLITVVASVFGIVNTQYISVLERTREIGLMKALGMRSRDVRRLFMLEAGWIGFLGGTIGTIVALLIAIPLNPWVTEKLDFGAGNSLLIFRPAQMFGLVAALIVVAMLAGFLPARKAAKLDPIEALRTE